MVLRAVEGPSARRALLSLLGLAAAWPARLRAQDTGKPWRIAFLAAGGAPRPGQFSTFDAITAGLRERGHGALQTRAWFAEGRTETLPALAQQALAWQPDLMITNLTPATLAARRATQTVPIVMAGSGDPVATGLVHSLARPSGNVTGVAALGPELAAKSVELLRELRPGLRRLGVLARGAQPADIPVQQPMEFDLVLNLQTARRLNIAVPQTMLLRASQVIE